MDSTTVDHQSRGLNMPKNHGSGQNIRVTAEAHQEI